MVRNRSLLMCWDCPGRTLDVALLSIDNGTVKADFSVPVTDVAAIVPLAADHYAVLSITGVYILDAASKSLSQRARFGPRGFFLDFGALAVDAGSRKLVVVTAGNYQRPGTRIAVLDL